MPGKGLARYRAQGAARLQPLPIRTAREVFPQAAHPVSFVERVMGRLGHEGHFHENCSALGSGGFSSPSTDPARHTSTHYSIAVIRCSDFAFRYIRRLSSCRPMGAFIISPLPHLDERSTHRSGPVPPGAFGCTPINSTTAPDPSPGRLRRHFPLTVIGGASSTSFPRRAPRASPVDTCSFVPCRR